MQQKKHAKIAVFFSGKLCKKYEVLIIKNFKLQKLLLFIRKNHIKKLFLSVLTKHQIRNLIWYLFVNMSHIAAKKKIDHPITKPNRKKTNTHVHVQFHHLKCKSYNRFRRLPSATLAANIIFEPVYLQQTTNGRAQHVFQ